MSTRQGKQSGMTRRPCATSVAGCGTMRAMKILHTSDWHVGKVLKGHPREAEHRQVLGEWVDLAEKNRPDLVVVAGDLYDTAAPSAESSRLVMRTLSALRQRA